MRRGNKFKLLTEERAARLELWSGLVMVIGGALLVVFGLLTIVFATGPLTAPATLWLIDCVSFAVSFVGGAANMWVDNRTPVNLAEQERLTVLAESDAEVRALLVRAVETYGALDRMHLASAQKLFDENEAAKVERGQRERAAVIKSRLAKVLEGAP
jgi:hypothetical protein